MAVNKLKISIDTWLYGELAQYGGKADEGSYANVRVIMDEGSTVNDLLEKLGMPTEQRGITFINGDLSALPGVQPDLDHVLHNGDRVGLFHLRSMWPYQYRAGAAMTNELSVALHTRTDQGISHSK